MRHAAVKCVSLHHCTCSSQISSILDDTVNELLSAQECNLGEDWILEEIKVTHPREDRALIVVVGRSMDRPQLYGSCELGGVGVASVGA